MTRVFTDVVRLLLAVTHCVPSMTMHVIPYGGLRCFQHCTGHTTTGSWKGRGNQYIQFVRVLYCKLTTNGKQLPAVPLEAALGTEPRPQRWEPRVLPLCHRGPCHTLWIQPNHRRYEVSWKPVPLPSKTTNLRVYHL